MFGFGGIILFVLLWILVGGCGGGLLWRGRGGYGGGCGRGRGYFGPEGPEGSGGASPDDRSTASRQAAEEPESPVDILKKRLARGEITVEEYRDALQELNR